MTQANEKQKVAQKALEILRYGEISKNKDPLEVLANVRFIMMSTIELDIWKTTKKIVEYLNKNRIEQASELLEKLEDLYLRAKWE